VQQATKDISKLKTTMEDKRTGQIVEQAKQNWSLIDQEFPSAEEVPLYGWDEKVAALQTKSKLFGDVPEEQDLEAMVEDMRDEFEELNWVGEGHEHLQAKSKGKAIKILFDIVARDTPTEGRVWDVTAVGRYPLTRVLKQREKKGHLKYLLVCYFTLFIWPLLTLPQVNAC
jgi:hypothetical protein